MIMSFLTNCLVDGVGEEGKGGEAALSQTLMQIFGGPLMIFVIVFHKTIEHHRYVQVLTLVTYYNWIVLLECG